MADHYHRNCRDCNEPIRMAKMDSGVWLAFDLTGGKHVCCSGFASAAVAVSSSPAPRFEPSFNAPASGRGGRIAGPADSMPVSQILPRWLWIVLMILVLIVMFLNWVSGWWPW